VFGQSLGSEIVAEGASAIDDLLELRALGVRLAQCFLLGEPSPRWAPAQVPLPFAVIANLRTPERAARSDLSRSPARESDG
jgi:EAL domain-containing protein (putative c-di-GMP-specific phosphodiesterase class I)